VVSGLSIRPLHFPTNFVPNNTRRDFLVVVDNAYGGYVDQPEYIRQKVTFSSCAINFRRAENICICEYNVTLLAKYKQGEQNIILCRRKIGSPKMLSSRISGSPKIEKFLKYSSWRPFGFFVEIRW
jgi:hypothetical protein